jgi:hypothetical protein
VCKGAAETALVVGRGPVLPAERGDPAQEAVRWMLGGERDAAEDL